MINLQLHRRIFNDVYYPHLFDYNHRFDIFFGGSGSGKSVFVCQKILVKALNEVRIVLVVRKTLTSQRKSCWQLFLDTLEKWQLTGDCKINKSDYTIVLPNGSIIYIAGIDNPERIKSIVGITDIWCEEATELNEEDFDQLNLRMRAKAKYQQIFVSFNPISKANWVYKRWFEHPESNDNTVSILKTTYRDNKFLPKEYIETLQNMIKTNPVYYKIYALGDFCTLDKLVYTNWEIQQFDYRQIKGELLIGLDFGFVNDPSAIVASILTKDTIYIFKEWGDRNKTNKQIADIIKSLGFAKSVIIADSAEPKSVAEIKKEGIIRIRESVKGQDSIIHGIQRLQQYKIIVHPSCKEIITEFENYSWEKDKQTGEYINKPIDMFNHYLDALRYSLQCVDVVRIQTMSKELLGL